MKFDSLKVGTTTYRQVTVLGYNDTDLYFTHSGGIANVKLKYLEPAIQKAFNYDPKSAAAAERDQAKSEAAFQESVAHSVVEQSQKAAAAAAPPPPEDLPADPVSDLSPLNKAAPKITVAKWIGEPPKTEGKSVIVLFWATWSPACRETVGTLNEIQKKYSDQLVVIGVSAEPEQTVADFAAPKLEFSSSVDSANKMAVALGVTSVPQVLLIDPGGIARYLGHPAALDPAKLERLLGKPPE